MSQRLDLPLGACAEYIVVEEAEVAVAPHGMAAVAASTLSLNGLTAWQARDARVLEADRWLLVRLVLVP